MFAAALFSIVFGLVNLVISTIQLSLYIGTTGVCALLLGLTKLYALSEFRKISLHENEVAAQKTELVCMRRIALAMTLVAFLHFSFAIVCLFFFEESPANYGLYYIVFTAAMTFFNLIFSSVNFMRSKKTGRCFTLSS